MAPRPKKILHVEDDPEWIDIVRNSLEGFVVFSAHDLKEAVKLSSRKKFDAAILDISLVPDDSQDAQGERFLNALEGLSLLPGKRIIILSAYLLGSNQERTRKYFRYYKVLDAIPKQKFDSKEFKEMVESAVMSKSA